MQVGCDALALELGGLVGAAAGDQCERRLHLADHGELLGSQLRRNEAQDADSPGTSAEQLRSVAQEAFALPARAATPGQGRGARRLAATAWANAATSLTRVIGPWRIG